MKKLNQFYSNYLLKIIPTPYISVLNQDLYLNISLSKFIVIFNFFKYHTHCQYKILTDICGIDYLSKKNRFHVFYNLLSIKFNHRIFINVQFKESMFLPSLIEIYRNSNWFEREVWDMFGIFFQNHPDLRRILTDYGFQNHPLRKNFPLSGYLEVSYNHRDQQIQYKSLNLAQEYRYYSFHNPWTIQN